MTAYGHAAEQTYEQFKQGVFDAKMTAHKNSLRKNPLNSSETQPPSKQKPRSFFRKTMLLTFFGVGFYYINKEFKLVDKLFEYVYDGNPIARLSVEALIADTQRRLNDKFQINPINSNKDARFANLYLDSELDALSGKLFNRYTERVLSEEKKSNFILGPFRFGIKSSVLKIDEYGNVVNESKSNKIEIGGLAIFGSKRKEIIEYEKTMGLVMKSKLSKEKIDKACETINMMNKVFLKGEEYEQVYEECYEKNGRKMNKIYDKILKIRMSTGAEEGKKRFLFSLV